MNRSAIFSAIVLVLAVGLNVPYQAMAASTLPPEIQLDILTAELAKAIESNDHKRVVDTISRMRNEGIGLPPRFLYVEARSLAALDKNLEARRTLERYMKEEGRKGKYYDQALKLFVEIKDKAASEEARERAAEERRLAEERRRRKAEADRIEAQAKREKYLAELDQHAATACQKRKESDEKIKSQWEPVGQIARINTEWKYFVIALNEGVVLETDPEALKKKPIWLFLFDGKRMYRFNLPPKVTGNEASVTLKPDVFSKFKVGNKEYDTLAENFSKVKVGDTVYRSTTLSRYFGCVDNELCKKIEQLCPGAGRITR